MTSFATRFLAKRFPSCFSLWVCIKVCVFCFKHLHWWRQTSGRNLEEINNTRVQNIRHTALEACEISALGLGVSTQVWRNSGNHVMYISADQFYSLRCTLNSEQKFLLSCNSQWTQQEEVQRWSQISRRISQNRV